MASNVSHRHTGTIIGAVTLRVAVAIVYVAIAFGAMYGMLYTASLMW